MDTLEIALGGRLLNHEWNSEQAAVTSNDVTDRAPSLIFHDCRLAGGATLRDVFLLLQSSLDTFDTVLGNRCAEFVRDGLTPGARRQTNGRIQFLELYWQMSVHSDDATGRTTIAGYAFPHFHGIGSEREQWDLSLMTCAELADLPVRLRAGLEIHVDRQDSLEDRVDYYDQCEYTLGHILHGIMWELSFHGPPARRDATTRELEGR